MWLPSGDDVDAVPKWQGQNVHPGILADILIEFSDGVCHLILHAP